MPRILRIINRYNLGGPTYNAAYLTKYLAPEYETMLIGGSPQPHEAHSGYILDQLFVPYIEIPEMGRSVRLLDDWRTYRKISKHIREFRPDIVHTHAAKAGAIGRLAARRHGVRVVVHTYHGHVFDGYFTGLKNKMVKAIERALGLLTTAVVAISPIQKQQIGQVHRIVPLSKMHVIPLGFDLSRFSTNQTSKRLQFRTTYQLAEHEVAIGIIGRLTPIKQHELFLHAFAEIAVQLHHVKAFVIGDGECMEQLQQQWLVLSNQHQLNADRLRFTSWIKEVDVALAGLDIVAMTSLNEGTPVSLIEAQAAGKPVVTTHVGGVADCVDHMRTGIIIDDHQSGTLAAALQRLAMNAQERESMGRLGRDFVSQKYSYTRLVSDMDQLYRTLLRRTV